MRTFGRTFTMTFMLFFFALTGYAEQNGQGNQISREHVSQLFQWLNSVGHFEKMSQKEISSHFDKEFKYYTNGKLGATNAVNLQQRFMSAKHFYTSAYIHFPIKDILVDGNKAAAKFRVTFIDINGTHKDTGNTVIILFNKNGKVVEFSQSFDKGAPLPS